MIYLLTSPSNLESTDDTESIETWVTQQLNTNINGKDLLQHIQEKQANTTLLKLNDFQPQYCKYYQALQERIATACPEEHLRPSIILNIKGSSVDPTIKRADIGIFGGTGPLSDAEGLVKLVHSMSEDKLNNFSGVLYSFPPPRPKAQYNLKTHAINYLHNIILYTHQHPAQTYILLSNTAHLHINKIKMLLGKDKNKLENVVQNNVQIIKESINNTNKEACVLVLGTEQADDKRLYPKKFDAAGVINKLPQQNLNADENVTINNIATVIPQAAKERLQWIIDQVKSGYADKEITSTNAQFNNKTAGQMFIDFVQTEIINNKTTPPITKLLFSCTEIPLLLDTKYSMYSNDNAKITYNDKLNEMLQNHGLSTKNDAFDTEKMFVQYIATKQNENISKRVQTEQLPTNAQRAQQVLNNINVYLNTKFTNLSTAINELSNKFISIDKLTPQQQLSQIATKYNDLPVHSIEVQSEPKNIMPSPPPKDSPPKDSPQPEDIIKHPKLT